MDKIRGKKQRTEETCLGVNGKLKTYFHLRFNKLQKYCFKNGEWPSNKTGLVNVSEHVGSPTIKPHQSKLGKQEVFNCIIESLSSETNARTVVFWRNPGKDSDSRSCTRYFPHNWLSGRLYRCSSRNITRSINFTTTGGGSYHTITVRGKRDQFSFVTVKWREIFTQWHR